jgi:hypothetical protein
MLFKTDAIHLVRSLDIASQPEPAKTHNPVETTAQSEVARGFEPIPSTCSPV